MRYSTVSIHTPTKGVTKDNLPEQVNCGFQSTHPRRVWRIIALRNAIAVQFQSTHPRRVWLSHRNLFTAKVGVSIHTPTKGVTGVLQYVRPIGEVSIHTPTKGVTEAARYQLQAQRVSIHTPTKGVTYKHNLFITNIMFQSTHPRRVWLWAWWKCYTYVQVSIHTPTKGVTNTFRKNPYFSYVSIHTPTKGVTEVKELFTSRDFVSIHTPTKGVTRCVCFFSEITRVSIHTPTKGVTAYSANSWISWCKDNYFAKDGKIITRKIL